MSQISWESSPWKQFSLVNDEAVNSLSHAKVYVFSDPVLCLGKMNQNPISNTVWERQLEWFKDLLQYRTLDTIDGEPMEFEWNIFPGFSTLELVREVQKFMSKMGEPEQFQGIIFMSMFSDIIWGNKDNEKERIANATLVSLFAKDFQQDVGHSSEGQKPSGIPLTKKNQEENGIRVAEFDDGITFGESGNPVFRATSPLFRGTLKSKGGGKLSLHFCADGDTIETVFRTIISVNQLSIHGAEQDRRRRRQQ